jgi:hypothetical protein
MTSKVYRTAQGKSVDLGTIMLQNEHVRAVGNMNVNARGDKLDNNNRVVETKPRQIQKQNARTTNVSADPVQTSTIKARKARKEKSAELSNSSAQESATPVQELAPQPISAPPPQTEIKTERIPEGGLAAAIARNREVKQELEKTRRQQQQAQGLRKI